MICLGSIEFVEPDLSGLLPMSPPPDGGGDKRESAGGVNERTKKDGGGEHICVVFIEDFCMQCCASIIAIEKFEVKYLHCTHISLSDYCC